MFPSQRNRDKPLGTVKTAWRNTLKRAGVSYFPIYQFRYVFCTRVSKVAPDGVIQKAMRHSSPETKRFYQWEWWRRFGRRWIEATRGSTAIWNITFLAQ
jgi:integrase